MILRFIVLITLPFTGCAAVFMQTDGFGPKLDAGCSSEQQCQALVDEARQRNMTCKPNQMGSLKCSDTRRDMDRAGTLMRPWIQRQAEAKQEARRQDQRDRTAARVAERDARTREVDARQARLKDEREQYQADHEAKRQAKLATQRAHGEALAEAVKGEEGYRAASSRRCELQSYLADKRQDKRDMRKLDRASGTVQHGARRALVAEILDAERAVKCYARAIRQQFGERPLKCQGLALTEFEAEVGRRALHLGCEGGDHH